MAAIVGHAQPGEDEAECEVWFENRRTFELFVVLGTQWRVAGMGAFLGLDYAAVGAVMAMYRIKDQRAMLLDLRVMERAALPLLNKERQGND